MVTQRPDEFEQYAYPPCLSTGGSPRVLVPLVPVLRPAALQLMIGLLHGASSTHVSSTASTSTFPTGSRAVEVKYGALCNLIMFGICALGAGVSLPGVLFMLKVSQLRDIS